MWHCPTCDRLILDDNADCPKCGPRPRSPLPAEDSSRPLLDESEPSQQPGLGNALFMVAVVAVVFLVVGLLMLSLSRPVSEWKPMGVGCIFCSLTALVWVAIIHSLQAPTISNRKLARIQGRYSQRYVPPSREVYNTIIDLARYAPKPLRSFMPYRPSFRVAIKERPIPGLMLCMIDHDPRIQELAIFMLGLCKRKGLEPDFFEFTRSQHRFLRKRAIKALRKLSAWTMLQQVARFETDPQLRNLATFRRPSFGSRLQRLQQNLSATEVEPVETPLRVLVPLPLESTRGPKPAWRIRAILERIRALLGGARSPQ